MKKVLKTAIAVAMAAASSASAYSLWNLQDGEGQITNLGSGDQGGAFYWYDDQDPPNNGGSYTNMPDPSTEIDVLGPWLFDNNGRIEMYTTADYEYSFVGVGFNWLDPVAVFNPTSLAGGGLSVCYMSLAPMLVDLKVEPGDKYEWNSFVATLEAAPTPTHKTLPWAVFAQGDWGGKGDEPGGIVAYLESSAGVQFKFEGGGAAKTNVFHLGGLGWLGDANTCGDQLGAAAPVLSPGKFNGLNLVQNGRVLSFNGLNQAATIEVINMQGKLVSKDVVGVAKSTLNLSNLATGVYMIRVSGSTLNFTQKVMLK